MVLAGQAATLRSDKIWISTLALPSIHHHTRSSSPRTFDHTDFSSWAQVLIFTIGHGGPIKDPYWQDRGVRIPENWGHWELNYRSLVLASQPYFFEIRAQEYHCGVSWGWALGYCSPCSLWVALSGASLLPVSGASLVGLSIRLLWPPCILMTPPCSRSPRRDTAPPSTPHSSHLLSAWRWQCNGDDDGEKPSCRYIVDLNPIPSVASSSVASSSLTSLYLFTQNIDRRDKGCECSQQY